MRRKTFAAEGGQLRWVRRFQIEDDTSGRVLAAKLSELDAVLVCAALDAFAEPRTCCGTLHDLVTALDEEGFDGDRRRIHRLQRVAKEVLGEAGAVHA